jgi:hypothetical protein
MSSDGDMEAERRIVEPPPGDEKARAALRCLVRLRGEGRPADEIAAGLEAETGWRLSPETVERILRRIAGPTPREDGGDPRFFTGWLGGG